MDFNNQKGEDPTPRQYIASLLPDHYDVTNGVAGINCISAIGIEDDAEWQTFFEAVKKYFGSAFKEVYHSTCTYHLRFTVYYSQDKLWETTDKIDQLKSL